MQCKLAVQTVPVPGPPLIFCKPLRSSAAHQRCAPKAECQKQKYVQGVDLLFRKVGSELRKGGTSCMREAGYYEGSNVISMQFRSIPFSQAGVVIVDGQSASMGRERHPMRAECGSSTSGIA